MQQKGELWRVKTRLMKTDLFFSAVFPAGASGGKLGRRRYRFQTTTGEHLAEQVHDLLVQKPVCRKHFPAVETKWASVKTRNRPTRLHNQKRSGGRIPRIQIEFPIAVETSAGGVSQIERSGPGPPHTVGPQSNFLVEVDIGILVAFRLGNPVASKASERSQTLEERIRRPLR